MLEFIKRLFKPLKPGDILIENQYCSRFRYKGIVPQFGIELIEPTVKSDVWKGNSFHLKSNNIHGIELIDVGNYTRVKRGKN